MKILLADVVKSWQLYAESHGFWDMKDRVVYNNLGSAYVAGVRRGIRLQKAALRASKRPS